MTIKDRILAAYRGDTPDVVPFMLDLSHWYYHRNRLPWDLSLAYDEPEYGLIDYHKRMGVGFYMPNLGSFYSAEYGDDVQAETVKDEHGGVPEITWRFTTPLGRIERRRIWHENSYSWGISAWGVESEADLRVLGYALGSRRYAPRWDRYQAWSEYVGDDGVVYLPFGYSAMGQLLNYWMGVSGVMYAVADWPETMHEVVDRINENNLLEIDLLAASPADVVILGDNFSSDIQPPHFFAEWSRPFYQEAIRRLHDAGKYVSIHIDGQLHGALAMFRDIGADGADAVTPAPMGDLAPVACREEAGDRMLLSGGVPPNLWLPNVDLSDFRTAVLAWLDLKRKSPRLIANAGDQVPPGAEEERIVIMREMVEEYGRY